MSREQAYDVAALTIRAALGTMFIAHALTKLLVNTLPGTAQYFGSIGLPPALAYAVTGFEFVAGALLIAGFGVRVVALLAIPLLLGTIAAVHGANGWEFQNEGGGWEYPAFLIVACAVSATLGTGRFSLRDVIRPGVSPMLHSKA